MTTTARRYEGITGVKHRIESSTPEEEFERIQARQDASEAVEYVRKDVHEAHIAELEEREAALAAKLIEFHELANLANLMAAEDVCDALVSIDEKTPTDHLARHYLIKQVEALEGAADEFEVHERARQCLKWNAEKLRQQAEQC